MQIPDDAGNPPPAQPPARPPVTSLRALWPFVRQHRGLLAAWLVALAASSTATLALPVAFREMIDHGFAAGGGAAIDRAFALLFAVALVLALATAARFYFVSVLGERVVADLRRRLYAHLVSLDAAFFDRSRSGELVSRLTADAELLRSVVATSMSVALRSLVTFAGSIVMLFVTAPGLASYALFGIPLAVLPIVVGGRRLQKMSRLSQDRIADANTFANETLGAVRTVQAHAREPFERERFGAAVAVAVATARKRIKAQALVTAVAITLVFGAITLVLWSGAHDVADGRMSAGTLGQFVLYALIGGGSVGSLAEVWNDVQRAAGGMGRIAELLDARPAIVAPPHPRELPRPVRGEVRCDDVVFHYPGRPDLPALDGFDLHVRPGETVALVGPSGAGKSTVLALLLRFHDPEAGRVSLDGIDVRELDPAALRGAVALVPQQPTIFAASAADNIRYGRLDATDAEVEAAARSAEAHEFLAELPEGYASELGERGARLSGGQQQRVAIARALLKDAPVLLLDEATSALDAHSERAVQHALENLMEGRTTLVIAHRLATVLKADRIVVMDRGRIVAEGTHEALMAAGGLYAELAKLQFLELKELTMDTQALYYLLAGALVIVGLLGVILPALPGLPLVFAGMWLAAWAGGYAEVGVGTIIMLAVLTLLSLGVDIIAALMGAKRVGASRLALVGAAIGTVVGLFMGIVGILVGPFVGALVGEFLHGRKLDMAARVGVGTWLGIMFAAVLKLALGFAMVGIFALAWWL